MGVNYAKVKTKGENKMSKIGQIQMNLNGEAFHYISFVFGAGDYRSSKIEIYVTHFVKNEDGIVLIEDGDAVEQTQRFTVEKYVDNIIYLK